ncbi:MAG: Tm-1-like ATP-binding domain-containing protein [Clostridiales bacterium]|nr:Tm-1-like ATP-binding domain-containing protein [Clostridiales bacterium]
MKPTVVFVATYDTKGVESEYIKGRIEAYGSACLTIDVGVGGVPTATPDVSLADLCAGSEYDVDKIHSMPRGDAVAVSSDLVQKYVKNLFENGKCDAVIGIGGAGGTQICTQTMRSLPVGLPKLMMSTLAAGNMRWYVEDSDISMFPSITDVAGINCITQMVFDRFAAEAAMAAKWYAEQYGAHSARMADASVPRIGQTMYGTTTKGVTRAREELERRGYETLVFHASGAGGRAMESLVRRGVIHGVLDMTIAEIGAHLVGGLHDAGPNRLDAMCETGVPYVMVPGGADTIVLPPLNELPDKFRHGRVLNKHNPTMTTMRTNVEENQQIGEFIVNKLRNAKGPVKVLIPKGGLSSIDKPGDVFYMPEANEMLFETLKAGFKGTNVEVIEDPRHLYDPGFGEDAAALMDSLMHAAK